MSSSQQSEPPRSSSHTDAGPSNSDAAAPNGVESEYPATTQVVRLPRLALVGVALLLFGTLFPAASWPAAFGWLLILPVVACIWVLRVRTVVSPEGIVARRFAGSDSIGWESIKGIHFPDRRWARVVLDDDSEKSLPLIRFDRLPQLATASGGRITDPYAAAAAAAEEARREEDPQDGDSPQS